MTQAIRTKTIELPTFEQLNKAEKAKVIDNYRDINTEYEWHESDIDYLCDNEKENGYFDINYKDVSFSGFYSQGDGLSFTSAIIDWQKYIKDNAAKFPLLFDGLNKKYVGSLLREKITIELKTTNYRHHYVHERTVYLEVETNFDYSRPIEVTLEKMLIPEFKELELCLEQLRLNLCIDFYKVLETTYDSLREDSEVEASLIANEYTFNRETLKIDS